jgi:hypothetical protein
VDIFVVDLYSIILDSSIFKLVKGKIFKFILVHTVYTFFAISLLIKIAEPPSLCHVQCDQKFCAPDDYIPHTTDDLKMAIIEYIRKVERAILNTVFENTVRRVNKCLETGGEQF